MAWNYEREKLIKAVITQQEEFELSKQGFKTDTPKKKKKKVKKKIFFYLSIIFRCYFIYCFVAFLQTHF